MLYSVILVPSHFGGGDRDRTWTHTNRHSTGRSGLTRSKPDESSCFWPRDLLPSQLPDARILSWDYSRNSCANGRTLDLARGLLGDIGALGNYLGYGLPVVFVAHGVGGNIVKEVGACWCGHNLD